MNILGINEIFRLELGKSFRQVRKRLIKLKSTLLFLPSLSENLRATTELNKLLNEIY